MKIGELSRRTGLAIVTLRYYENEGLIESQRTSSNYRVFSPEMVQRVRQIQRFRALNLTIGEMKRLLEWSRQPRERCLETCNLIETHLRQVTERKEFLIELEAELQRLLDSCANVQGEDCAILRDFSGHGLGGA
ncbi:MerR family transcriptional regulator [bacterium]|nr:MerR family transcriptional regulator [bacterium]